MRRIDIDNLPSLTIAERECLLLYRQLPQERKDVCINVLRVMAKGHSVTFI